MKIFDYEINWMEWRRNSHDGSWNKNNTQTKGYLINGHIVWRKNTESLGVIYAKRATVESQSEIKSLKRVLFWFFSK